MTVFYRRSGRSKALILADHASSSLEETLAIHIKTHCLPTPQREYRFHDKRRWRFDFAWPDLKICAECEGSTYSKSRHTTGTGFHNDCIKYNTAVEMGWRVLRFDSKLIKSGQAIDCLIRCLNAVRDDDENLVG